MRHDGSEMEEPHHGRLVGFRIRHRVRDPPPTLILRLLSSPLDGRVNPRACERDAIRSAARPSGQPRACETIRAMRTV